MPSPVPAKYRGPVVRQLSLQNQTPLQSPGSHALKKQLSEDSSRSFDTVEVTGQKWTAADRPESILRVGSADAKSVQSGKFGIRPKPVKVAWADSKQNSTECSTGVEIVATKYPGQPRPLSIKTQRFRKPLLGNKDTLVYTRLQLAERLRNAWSEREKVKPNLNIFLAQPSDTARSDNMPSVRQQDNASTLSDPTVPDKKRKAVQSKGESEFLKSHCPPQEIIQPKLQTSLYEPKLQLDYFQKENEIAEKVEASSSGDEKNPTEERHCLQELKKVEIKLIKNELLQNKDSSELLPIGEKKENRTTEPSLEICQDENSEKRTQQPVIVSAQERRANFRRSGILHKTLTESFSSQMAPQFEDKDEHADEVKKLIPRKPPLVRALSAPTQEQSFQKQKIVKFQLQRRLQPTSSFDSTSLPSENMSEMRERIKSAPIRRKLKTAAIRRKNKDKSNSSSDEEKEAKEPSKTTKKTAKRTYVPKGAEIITMVSLVSPAESDTEDSVITLPMESLPTQEEKVETSRSNTAKDAEQKDSSSFDMQKFVSLRKTTKTVSFQTHPGLSKSYCSSFPSRRVPAGTPIIVPTPVNNNPALTPAQLQERDKRAPVFSGTDGRGIKRRLLRSTSEPAKEEDENQKSFNVVQDFGGDNGRTKKSGDADGDGEADGADSEIAALKELEFKYPREKECWNLYQKMVSKGVSVSYDTVLRESISLNIRSPVVAYCTSIQNQIFLRQGIKSEPEDVIREYKHVPLTKIIKMETRRKGDELEHEEIEFHFVVLILIRQRDALYRCTATVISKNWVMTSAHCLYVRLLQPKNILIVGGKTNLADYLLKRLSVDFKSDLDEDDFGVQELRIRYYRIHPIYDDRRFYHDIALLKTRKDFEFPIEPIKWATKKMISRKNCSIMGYGFNNPFQGILRTKSHLEVSTTEIGCILKKKGLFLCLHYLHKTQECLGEAGSPLLCDGAVWGISSFSLKDSKKKVECGPKVEMYFNALFFDRNWIGSVISFSNINKATAHCLTHDLITEKDILVIKGKGDLTKYLRVRDAINEAMLFAGASELDVEERHPSYFGIHPSFNTKDVYHNVGLIKLTLPFHSHIKHPTLLTERFKKPIRNCTVVGFGMLRNSPVRYDGAIRNLTNLTISIPRLGCNPKKKPHHFNKKIGPFVCFYLKTNYACPGDSGVPVMCGGKIVGISAVHEQHSIYKRNIRCVRHDDHWYYFNAVHYELRWIQNMLSKCDGLFEKKIISKRLSAFYWLFSFYWPFSAIFHQ